MKMFEYRRQHPLMIVQQSIRGFLQFIWLIFILLVTWSSTPNQDFSALYIIGVLFSVSFVWAVLSWAFFTYRFENDTLHVRTGVIFKNERSIRRERVQSVNVFTNFLQQPFRVSRLQIKTAGSATEVEFNLYSVKWEEAEHIRQVFQSNDMARTSEIVSGSRNPVYKVQKREMLIAGLTSGRFLILFTFLFALYSQFAQFIPEELVESLLDQLVSTPIHLILMLTTGLLLASWLASTIYFVIQYYDFTVTRQGDHLHLSWGIIEQKKVSVKVERVQALSVKETPLRQLFGRCSLNVELAGGASEKQEQLKTLCPILAVRNVDEFLLNILPEYTLPNKTDPLPPRSLRRYIFRAIVPPLLLILPLHYMQVPYIHLAYLSLAPVIGLALLRHREAATSIMGNHLFMRFRLFSKVSVMVKKNHLQSLTLASNPLQRISSLRNVSVAVLSSPMRAYFTVKDVDTKEVGKIWAWYSSDKRQ